MSQAKLNLFDKELQECAGLFKALSHPARLRIIEYLAEKKICITGNISDEIPLSRTTVSQHLKELKNAGIITGQVSGAKVNYCLSPDAVLKIKSAVDKFIDGIECNEAENCNCNTL